mmetsp:Transcript_30040/g.86180  ORF Transcript_30040/g.86180 Transcript_30040/m.86180 type:complete len:230 (+) Transcript_30040:2066-2755(+)
MASNAAQPRSASRNTAATARNGSGPSGHTPLLRELPGLRPSRAKDRSRPVARSNNTSHRFLRTSVPLPAACAKSWTTTEALAAARLSRKQMTAMSSWLVEPQAVPVSSRRFSANMLTSALPQAITAFGRTSAAPSKNSPVSVTSAARARSTNAQRSAVSFVLSEITSSNRAAKCGDRSAGPERLGGPLVTAPATEASAADGPLRPAAGTDRNARRSALRNSTGLPAAVA